MTEAGSEGFRHLLDILRKAEIRFFESPTTLTLLVPIGLGALVVNQTLIVSEEGDRLTIRASIPFAVPPGRRVATLDLVARLNVVVRAGHFDFDADAGEVHFRIEVRGPVKELSIDTLIRRGAASFNPIRDFWPVFEEVFFRNGVPKPLVADRIKRLQEAPADDLPRRRRFKRSDEGNNPGTA